VRKHLLQTKRGVITASGQLQLTKDLEAVLFFDEGKGSGAATQRLEERLALARLRLLSTAPAAFCPAIRLISTRGGKLTGGGTARVGS
jgi:hypothetical protein